MTTFVLDNYQSLAPNEKGQEPGAALKDGEVVIKEEPKKADSGMADIKVMVTGPISEIVANALNAVFKNEGLIEYTEESYLKNTGHTYAISVESMKQSRSVIVYCVDMESIVKDPVGRMNEVSKAVRNYATENHKDVLVYVETNKKPITVSSEAWFVSNVSSWAKSSFFSQEALTRYIQSMD